MKLNLERDALFSKYARKMLRDRYMTPTEVSPQESLMRAAIAFSDDASHAQRIYEYASKHWFMFATPVLSNGGTARGLPISCFLNYVGDSRQEIMETFTENAFLASNGGGIGTYWGALRSDGVATSRGSASTGVIPFIKMQDSQTLAFSQGVTRRGSAAAYMHISHPEIGEFLDVRKPTGDANRKSTNIHHGIVIPDSFMKLIEKRSKDKNFDDTWNLVDPHTKQITGSIPARVLWIKILQNRMETGEPYIVFEDTVNKYLPEFQKMIGLKVVQSNLCSEITLPTDENRTAVCCLSSLNAEKFDEWSNHPTFIEDLFRMLDNILTVFIKTAPSEMYKAIYSAQRERAVGLGLMGFHAYLQRLNVPFESPQAREINTEIFKLIKSKADKASQILAQERGECPDAEGFNERFSHKLAIAPNASSSFLCGDTSPGIEPVPANIITRKTLSGSDELRNPRLEKILDSLGKNTEQVWRSIRSNEGSVQHLDFLDSKQKEVFKTAWEIDQRWVITHAADRTPYICQSQSLNLYLRPDISKVDLHNLHLSAWQLGVKTLYYVRSQAARRAETIQVEKERKDIFTQEDECLACEA